MGTISLLTQICILAQSCDVIPEVFAGELLHVKGSCHWTASSFKLKWPEWTHNMRLVLHRIINFGICVVLWAQCSTTCAYVVWMCCNLYIIRSQCQSHVTVHDKYRYNYSWHLTFSNNGKRKNFTVPLLKLGRKNPLPWILFLVDTLNWAGFSSDCGSRSGSLWKLSGLDWSLLLGIVGISLVLGSDGSGMLCGALPVIRRSLRLRPWSCPFAVSITM